MENNANLGQWETPDDELIIQRRLGKELRRSFEAMVEEPLPERMALLLVELALAQALRLKNNHEGSP
jgi:hypothetical protein